MVCSLSLSRRGLRERITLLDSSGATQRHPVQPEIQLRNSRWRTSSVYLTSSRQLSRCACVVPRANFAAEFLACNPSCGWHPTFSNPSRAAGQALEGAWLEDLQPAPDAQLGKKRGRPGRPSKKDSMSKCDSCRKQKRPCGPGCPHRMVPVQDEGVIAGPAPSAVVRSGFRP